MNLSISKTMRAALVISAIVASAPPSFAQAYASANVALGKLTPPYRVHDLRNVVLSVKNHYGVNLLFEEKLLEGITVVDPVIDYALDVEQNLNLVLQRHGLKLLAVSDHSYLIVSSEVKKRKTESSRTPDLSKLHVIETARSTSTYINETVRKIEFRISGKITDEAGLGMPGVNVIEKGTVNGTTTDVDGNYAINVENANSILVISFIGYVSQEVPVNGRGIVNVSLTSDVTELSEVVVIGYGTMQKRDVSSSIASVSAEDIKDRPVSGFDQAIAGKMAGVRVSTSNGAPGAGQNVIIRGIGSINASPAPLYVIDGMPYPDSYDRHESPLNSINPSDIASIEVLKDAAASSIYGARASNGVVLITTKRGKSGKPSFTVNVSTAVQNMINTPRMLNNAEYKQYLADSKSQAYVLQDRNFWDDTKRTYTWDDPNDVRFENLTATNAQNINGNPMVKNWFILTDELRDNPNDVNWMDEISRTGRINDFQMNVEGGSDNVVYRVSGNVFDQEGIVKASGYKRYSGRVNLDIKVNDYIKIGMNLAPSYEKFDKLSRMESNGTPGGGIFGRTLTMPPIFVPFDENGELTYLNPVGTPYDFDIDPTVINPYHFFDIKDDAYVMRNIGSVYGEVNVLKNLTFRSELHTEIMNRVGEYFSPSTVPTNSAPVSRSVGSNNRDSRIYVNTQNILTYAKAFGKHNVTALAGYQAEQTTWRNDYMRKFDFFVNEITTINNSATIDNPLGDVRSHEGSSTMIGKFVRAMYNFDGKYYLTASFRRDGSSKFGADNRWGDFPSFSAAWRISDEPFMDWSKEIVSDWKLRGGWGRVGNSSIGDFLAVNRLTNSQYHFGNASEIFVGMYDQSIAFSGLGWETTEDFDLGMDIQVLQGRIELGYDYFIRKTTDMLYNVTLMAHTGFGSQTRNISAMENRGQEVTIRSRNMVRALKWTTDLNISYVRNKVVDLGPQKSPLIGTDTRSDEGKPLSNIFGYHYLGPYRDWEAAKTNPNMYSTDPMYRSIPGDARFADVNMDGIIDSNDMTVLGNAQPDFLFGIVNNFSYKNFELGIQVNGVQGGDINLRSFRTTMFGANNGRVNIPYYVYKDYWRPDRPDGKYEAPSRKKLSQIFATSGQTVEKSSYISINNITLAYNVTPDVVKRMGLNSCRVYTSIQNAHIFTNYHGFNPESNVAGLSAATQGVDEMGYPLSRTVSFGLNVGF